MRKRNNIKAKAFKKTVALGLALSMTVGSAGVFPYGSLANGINVTFADENGDVTVLWSSEGGVSNEVVFGENEDWDSWDNQIKLFLDGNGGAVKKGSSLNYTMTIDKDEYDSLMEDGYIKFEVCFFNEANNWDNVVKLGWPMYGASGFADNGDGTYSNKVTMEFGEDLNTFSQVLIRGVGTLFAGDVTFSDISITKEEEVILEEKEPTVVADFAEGITGWEGDYGWDYSHGKDRTEGETPSEKTEVSWDEESGSLKVSLDYSKDLSSGWSEAKVKGEFEAVDITNYNMITFSLIYPSDMESVRTKLFMSDVTGEKEILNSEGSFRTKTVEDLGNGFSKATIRGEFKAQEAEVSSVVIGIVGPYENLKTVYIDDVVIGQLDTSEDYVKITEKVKAEVDSVDLSKMASAVKLVDANATKETKTLAAYLAAVRSDDKVLFGHQNSTFRSVRDNGETSDVKDITGSEAGLFGIDSLALAGVETAKTTTKEAIEASVDASLKAYNGGSLITLSCHMPNFTSSLIKESDDKYKYDFTKCDFIESKDLTPCADYILEGGEYNDRFNAYLDIIADYALNLQEKGIPVLFRPFHENSGGWFWWGTSTSVSSYKAMWRYMVSYLDKAGVHNFVYVYSPNGPFADEKSYLERYPGDEYVDVIAFDFYDDYADVNTYTGDNFFESLKESCQVVAKIADERGKIPAIAETGIRITGAGKDSLIVSGNPTTGHDWYNKVVDTAVSCDIPYFLLWANFDNNNFFVPYKYNDTLGHEMINEFISAYNNEKSVFGNGTFFYIDGDNGSDDGAVSKADNVSLTGYSNELRGYVISPKNYAVIKEPCFLTANVSNAANVEFVLKGADTDEGIAIAAVKGDGNIYKAEITQEILDKIGISGTGSVEVYAYDTEGSKIEIGGAYFINFNKDPDVMPDYVIDNFEYYYGNDALLNAKWGESNSASGCNSYMSLEKSDNVEGDFGGAFNYKLNFKGSEVWTGGLGRVFDKTDYSEYNAISMWVKPDGNGQKMVIQLNDSYEAYLSDFVKGTDSKYITIPLSSFIKKGGSDSVDISNITNFKLWCNSIPDNYSGQKDDDGNYVVNGKIVFDDIRFVKVSDEDLGNVDENGIIISDEKLTDLSDENANSNENNNDDGKDTDKDTNKNDGTNQGGDVSKDDENVLAKGSVIKDSKSKAKYVVLSIGKNGGRVAYKKLLNKKAKSIAVPSIIKKDGITLKVTSIAANAFKGNKKLSKVTIGKNITTIGKKAFFNCKKLKKVIVKSKKLKKIGKKAFYRKKGKKVLFKLFGNKKKTKKLLKKAKTNNYKVK